jgi:hypothetical protein
MYKNMTKQEFLLAILHKLEPERPPAKWLAIMVEFNLFGEQTLDKINNIIADSIKHTQDQAIQSKLQQVHTKLESILAREQAEREIELQEAEDLLAQL